VRVRDGVLAAGKRGSCPAGKMGSDGAVRHGGCFAKLTDSQAEREINGLDFWPICLSISLIFKG